MHEARVEAKIKRSDYDISSDALFCSPLGIQPGIVRQTREKFSSDTDCSSIQRNGVIPRPIFGGSANARLKTTYEGVLTNTNQTRSNPSTPAKFSRRFPLSNNLLEKIYSSESNLYDASRMSYFRWDQLNYDKTPTPCVPITGSEKCTGSTVDYHSFSPCSTATTTRNLFESCRSPLSLQSNKKTENVRLSSCSEPPTGSFVEQENPRIRPLFSFRDFQNFQPPLLTTGKNGFGPIYSTHNINCSPHANEVNKQESFVKSNASPNSRQSETTEDMINTTEESSGTNSIKQQPKGTHVQDVSQNAAILPVVADSKTEKGNSAGQRRSAQSFIFKDHTPFSYIASPSVITRQLSLLKSQNGLSINKKRQPFIGVNQDYEFARHRDPTTSESPASFTSFPEGGHNLQCTGKTTKADDFVSSYLKPYSPSEKLICSPKSAKHLGPIHDAVDKPQQQINEPKSQLFDRQYPEVSEESRGHLSTIECKNKELTKGSELLYSVRDSPLGTKQENFLVKRTSRVGQYANSRTFPGSISRDKVLTTLPMGWGCESTAHSIRYGETAQRESRSEVTTKIHGPLPNGHIQLKTDRGTEVYQENNKRRQRFGRSLSNIEPRMENVFKTEMPDRFKKQNLFIPKVSQEDNKITAKEDSGHQTPVDKIIPEAQIRQNKLRFDVQLHESNEPQLTKKQITGILERTLKFRTGPPEMKTNTSETGNQYTEGHKRDTQRETITKLNNHSVKRDDAVEPRSGFSVTPVNNKNDQTPEELSYNKKKEINGYTEELSRKCFDSQPESEKRFTRELQEKINQQVAHFAKPNVKSGTAVNVKEYAMPEKSESNCFSMMKSFTSKKLDATKDSELHKPVQHAVAGAAGANIERNAKTVESMPKPYASLLSLSSDSNTIDMSHPRPSASTVSPHDLAAPLMSNRPFRQTSNQTITKRPDFNIIAEKLEKHFKQSVNLTRSQSSIFPSTNSAKPQENEVENKATPEMHKSDERAPETSPVVRSSKRPKSLSVFEDDILKPVRVRLFEELTQTLARRSGNFEESSHSRKPLEQQTYKSILRPKAIENTEVSNGILIL